MVKLYTKNVCPKCMLIKTVMDAAGVKYETVNIDLDDVAKAIVVDAGFMAVPILEVDGELIGDFSAIQRKVNELAE